MKLSNVEAHMNSKSSFSAAEFPWNDRGGRNALESGRALPPWTNPSATQSPRPSLAPFRLTAVRPVSGSLLLCLGLALGALPATVRAQPNYANENDVAAYVRQMLYWTDATGADKAIAAFRYKDLLYTNDSGVRPQLEKFPDYYDPAARDRAQLAEEHLRRGLTNAPASALLGNLLLDLRYDKTVAEGILARQALAGAAFTRFAQTSAPPAFVIDAEIAAYSNAWHATRQALATYLSLLTNHLGVTAAPAPPLGYQIFRQLVPDRSLNPATYLSNGVPLSVITNSHPLFGGYKDLVVLYGLLNDYGRAAVELARLQLCLATTAGSTQASATMTEAQRFIYLHGELLRGIWPSLVPSELDGAGLAETMASCSQRLNELATLRQFLAGKRNILGFEPDFLMLVQKFTGGTTYYDSYDALRERLSPAYTVGPLYYAKSDWLAARSSYQTFRGYEDQLAAQFRLLTAEAEDRLFVIVGAYPGDEAYETPQENEGSELWQQLRSLEVARLRIQRNQAEIANLKKEIDIELWRAGAVTNAYIKYANTRASIAEKIGHINAVQGAANAAAEAANASAWWGAAAQVANAAVQAGAEEWKGQLEAEKERQAGMEQAEIEGIESKARVKTLLLSMNTLAVDSQEAALLLKQEMGRFTALWREKQQLESELAQNQEDLADRYFADPSHHLLAQRDMLVANLSFEEAQRWMFFMTRALEYKWNQRFTNNSPDGRTWSSASVFKLRNAVELEDLWRAMDSYEQLIAGTVMVGTNRFDWFSVRKDFLGYHDGRQYEDLLTGQMLDPISAFRTNLLRRLVTVSGGQECVIDFDTVRQIPGGFFFVGPVFTTNQPPTVHDPGRFLDKINYLKIRLVGSAMTYTNPLAGRLSYGGTSYLRNPRVGRFDSARPDRLQNEFTTYATRYWYNFGSGWEFTDRQTVSEAFMDRNPVSDPNTPPGTEEIWEFKERSVAATGWKLTLPTIALGQRVLHVTELDDIIIYFHHRSAQRFP
jgi:hypothetical protein